MIPAQWYLVTVDLTRQRIVGALTTSRALPMVPGIRYVPVDEPDWILFRYDPAIDEVVRRDAADFEAIGWSPFDATCKRRHVRGVIERRIMELDVERVRAHRAASG